MFQERVVQEDDPVRFLHDLRFQLEQAQAFGLLWLLLAAFVEGLGVHEGKDDFDFFEVEAFFSLGDDLVDQVFLFDDSVEGVLFGASGS